MFLISVGVSIYIVLCTVMPHTLLYVSVNLLQTIYWLVVKFIYTLGPA